MTLPKFILGDNTEYPEAIFVIHTEFPRFIINLENDEIEWLDDFDQNDKGTITRGNPTCFKTSIQLL
jgi:hypothetical protein